MDIGNALRRAWRDDIATYAIISNTVKEIYLQKTWVTISIQSVQIKWQKVFIKTWKSLINSELTLISEDIKKASLQKLWDLWIILSESIIFRFI